MGGGVMETLVDHLGLAWQARTRSVEGRGRIEREPVRFRPGMFAHAINSHSLAYTSEEV